MMLYCNVKGKEKVVRKFEKAYRNKTFSVRKFYKKAGSLY